MSMAEHVFAVVLAGGSGTRFWPKSRARAPKQLCKIGSHDESMLSLTLKRLDGFIPPERRMIITHQDQVEQTRLDVGDQCPHILAEPEGRNTAPALALGALEVERQNRSQRPPVMISLHADAVITDLNLYLESLGEAVQVAEQENVLTLLGIKPSSAETGYGYIEIGDKLSALGYRVASFKEKPDKDLAEKYLKAANLYWNSGIFVWKTSTILEEFASYAPQILNPLKLCFGNHTSFNQIDIQQRRSVYQSLPKLAIDNVILESSKRVAMIPATFGWQDVGSWDALSQTFPTDDAGNLTYGDVLLIDSHGTTVDSDGPLIAGIGLEDMVVVAAKGAILVCPKSRSQEIKKIVEQLQTNQRTEFL